MRIIAGKNKGTKLYTLDDNEITRPTLDRVKEALFSMLLPYLNNASVLDLFSGSGALALESISRGASLATICDKSIKAISIIKKNISKTKQEEFVKVLNKDFEIALKELENEKFDIIFLDPPYKTDYIIKALKIILQNNMITDDGIIAIETDDSQKVTDNINDLNVNITVNRKYGRAHILLLEKRKG